MEKKTLKQRIRSEMMVKEKYIWVVEACMINSKERPWIPADFFGYGDYKMPFASANLHTAREFRKKMLSANYENWHEKELRISKYVFNERWHRKDVRTNANN